VSGSADYLSRGVTSNSAGNIAQVTNRAGNYFANYRAGNYRAGNYRAVTVSARAAIAQVTIGIRLSRG
jgi:hypothetical protein